MPKAKRNPLVQGATERLLGAVLAGGVAARLSYRLGGLGRVGVTRHEVPLPPGLRLARPLRVGFASDFHAGPTTDPALFDELLGHIRREAPDVLLLGGDYVSFAAHHIDALQRFLRGARAPFGTFAVLGNHDVWNGRARVEAGLRDAGIDVLVNRSMALPEPFGAVSICGIDDPWLGAPAAGPTFAQAGPVRIYLMHSPDGLHWLDGQQFALGLAGHTHGGQIALRDGTPLFHAGGPWSREHTYGRFELPGNGPLVVSRGVGCSAIPLRLNADPELLICTLR
jgi:predicted MPP superfamily phosphohydrolase